MDDDHCRGTNKVILNWQRALWEGDWEVIKRSCRDEPIQVVIYMCMEAMLGISLYSYLYLKLAKMLSFFLLLMFSTKLEKRAEQVLPRSEGGGDRRGGGWGEGGRYGPNNVNIYV
jgi:hypothetical protein